MQYIITDINYTESINTEILADHHNVQEIKSKTQSFLATPDPPERFLWGCRFMIQSI